LELAKSNHFFQQLLDNDTKYQRVHLREASVLSESTRNETAADNINTSSNVTIAGEPTNLRGTDINGSDDDTIKKSVINDFENIAGGRSRAAINFSNGENQQHESAGTTLNSWYLYLASSDAAVGMIVTITVLYPGIVALDCLQSYWLGHWVTRSGSSSSSDHQDQTISLRKEYGLLLGFFFLALCLRCRLLSHFIGRSSTKLHRDALHALLRAPMTVFEKTPAGHILNRFSNDQVRVSHKIYVNYLLLTDDSFVVAC